MEKVIRDESFSVDEGILHHKEGVDLMPANIELRAMEMSLVNAMSPEFTLRTYVNEVKKNYDTVLIDCMPSLGMITIQQPVSSFTRIRFQSPLTSVFLPRNGRTSVYEIPRGLTSKNQTARMTSTQPFRDAFSDFGSF